VSAEQKLAKSEMIAYVDGFIPIPTNWFSDAEQIVRLLAAFC
jgi:hypothetical protein